MYVDEGAKLNLFKTIACERSESRFTHLKDVGIRFAVTLSASLAAQIQSVCVS
jgi:hypothetical protein